MQVGKWVGVGLFVGFVSAASLQASDSSRTNSVSEPSGAAVNPDNTRKNTRDRENATLTPGDQGEDKADLETTRNIRRAVMKDDRLSFTAKNIKIITINGKVTLRGPVKSDEERQLINQIAEKQHVSSLDNELEVEHQTNH